MHGNMQVATEPGTQLAQKAGLGARIGPLATPWPSCAGRAPSWTLFCVDAELPAKLSGWREEFLAGGEARLKHRAEAVEAEHTRWPKAVVADLATDKALLPEKIRHSGGRPPFGLVESKR